jgi:ParB family chromosome partitioning protein
MAKKTTPLPSTKPRRSYVTNFEQLKAEVLSDGIEPASHQSLLQIPIEQLRRGRYQPRDPVADGALAELADSIKTLGVLEPLIVRPLQDGHSYEILAGHRRWHAARKAGLVHVPVVVRQTDDRTAAAITLVENLQRQDLNPMEEARALQTLMDEFQLSQVEIGELVSKSKSVISRSLGLLSLTEVVQGYIESGQLDAGHGRVLINLPDDDQATLADRAVRNGWSVRELEKRRAGLSLKKSLRRPPSENSDVRRLEAKLSDWLATTVAVRPNGKDDGGKIVINYRDRRERQSIIDRIGLKDEVEK